MSITCMEPKEIAISFFSLFFFSFSHTHTLLIDNVVETNTLAIGMGLREESTVEEESRSFFGMMVLSENLL